MSMQCMASSTAASACPHCLDARGHALQVLADRDHLRGNGAGLAAFETNPLDGSRVALLLVIRLGGKADRHARSPQGQKIHLAEDLLELFSLLDTLSRTHFNGQLLTARRLHVLRREPRKSRPNKRSPDNM